LDYNRTDSYYHTCNRPTFYNIYKKKSTEGYQSIPYVVALCSAMILIYYIHLLGAMVDVLTINAIGVFIETIYIVFYIFYAPKKAKVSFLSTLINKVVLLKYLITLKIIFDVARAGPNYKATSFICGGWLWRSFSRRSISIKRSNSYQNCWMDIYCVFSMYVCSTIRHNGMSTNVIIIIIVFNYFKNYVYSNLILYYFILCREKLSKQRMWNTCHFSYRFSSH